MASVPTKKPWIERVSETKPEKQLMKVRIGGESPRKWLERLHPGGGSLTTHRLLPYAAFSLIIAPSFAADLILPHGATAAIGYCLVPVLARAFRQWSSLLPLAVICTILTWIGHFLGAAGSPWWVSVFDRGMITAVLWLMLLLIWRQMEVEALRDAMRKLHRTNAALENFSSGVRGPLRSIPMAVKILSTRGAVKADPGCKDWIDSIVAEISQVNNLIERLLSYARIGAGK